MLDKMEQLGRSLAEQGLVLRTGNCTGADQAFQRGANSISPKLVELCLPWPGYEAASIRLGNAVHMPNRPAYEIAAQYHPACKLYKGYAGFARSERANYLRGRAGAAGGICAMLDTKGKAVGGTALGIRSPSVWDCGTELSE